MHRHTSNDRIVLAIESAVRGGSVCLLRGNSLLGAMIGEADVSRAEELLPKIVALLAASEAGKDEIELIAVSNGPGSFTGIRIGIATALGLARSLDAPCVGISILEAVARVRSTARHVTVALPFGRNDVCYQMFERIESDIVNLLPPKIVEHSEFVNIIRSEGESELLLHPYLYPKLAFSPDTANLQRRAEVDANLAFAIGSAANLLPDLGVPRAVYLQNRHFAANLVND